MNWRNGRALIRLEWYSRYGSCFNGFYMHPLSLYLSSFFELFPLLGVTRRRPRLGYNYLTDFSRSKARTTEAKKMYGTDLITLSMFYRCIARYVVRDDGGERLKGMKIYPATTITRRRRRRGRRRRRAECAWLVVVNARTWPPDVNR